MAGLLGHFHVWTGMTPSGNPVLVYTRTANPSLSDEFMSGYVSGGRFYNSSEWNVIGDQPNAGISSDEMMVNYNKTRGNKVVIKYTSGAEIGWSVAKIVSYTDDFIPGSEGAIYEFHFPNAPTQIMVVGEVPESQDSSFDGRWGFLSEGGEVSRVVAYGGNNHFSIVQTSFGYVIAQSGVGNWDT